MWVSVYLLFLNFSCPNSTSFFPLSLGHMVPTEDEWSYLEDLVKVLHPFKIVMKRLEGDKYCTVSWVPTMISFLRKKLADAKLAYPTLDQEEGDLHDDDEREEDFLIEDVLPDLIKKMHKDFEDRWGCGDFRQFDASVTRGFMNRQIGIHPSLVIASALDPRFKSLSCFWIEEDKEAIWNALLQEMIVYARNLDPDIRANDEPGDNTEVEVEVNGTDEIDDYLLELEEDHRDDMIVLNQNLEEENNDQRDDRIARMCKRELKIYRELLPLAVWNNPNQRFVCPLLDFWLPNQSKFPILSQLARKFLCIQATSASSERIFSIASNIISKFRNRLSPENAGTILFVNKMLEWYKQESGEGI